MKNALLAGLLLTGLTHAALADNPEDYRRRDFKFATCKGGDFIIGVYEDGIGILPVSNKNIVHAVDAARSPNASSLHIEAYRYNGLQQEGRQYIIIDLDRNSLSFYDWGARKPYYTDSCRFNNLSLFKGFLRQ